MNLCQATPEFLTTESNIDIQADLDDCMRDTPTPDGAIFWTYTY